MRGLRRKRTPEERDFAAWSSDLATADDAYAATLAKIGKARGWVGAGGAIVPPGTPKPEAPNSMNAIIRAASGRRIDLFVKDGDVSDG